VAVASRHYVHPIEWEFVYAAVALDAFSRKVVDWELDKKSAVRLALAALYKRLPFRPSPLNIRRATAAPSSYGLPGRFRAHMATQAGKKAKSSFLSRVHFAEWNRVRDFRLRQ
jgi:transposase InsO family protein